MIYWRKDSSQPLPAARIGHIAIAVDARAVWGEELVVVHGGIGENKSPLRDVSVLEVGGRHWLCPAPASGGGPAARAFHSAAAVGRRLFLFGGHVYVKEKRGLQKFDDMWALDTDSWEWSQQIAPEGSPHPVARDFAAMVSLPGGRLLLFGGLDASERRLDDIWIFHPRTQEWKEIKTTGTKPKPRYGHGLVLLAPPATSTGPPLDLLTGSAEEPAQSSDAIAAAAEAEARVLLFGGETAGGAVNDLWVLRGAGSGGDSNEGTWIAVDAKGSAPTARKGHAVVGTARGVVVACGHTATVGWLRSRTDVYHGDAHLLEVAPGGLRWVVAAEGPTEANNVMPPEMAAEVAPEPREFHSLTALSDGRVLMLGGGNGKDMIGDAWWLDFGQKKQTPSAQQLYPPQQAAAPVTHQGPPVRPSPAKGKHDDTRPTPFNPLPLPPPQQAATAASSWWKGSTQDPPLPAGRLSPMNSVMTSSGSAPGGSHLGSVLRQQLGAHPPAEATLEEMDSATAAAVATAAAAAEVEAFRESLGLPMDQPSAALPPPVLPLEADEAMLALGRRALAIQSGVHSVSPLLPYAVRPAVSPAACFTAARSAFAASGEGQSLQLEDLGVLLSDYKRLVYSSVLPLPLSHEAREAQDSAGRFVHMAAVDMRLGDLPQLLDSYRALLAAQ